MAMSRKHYQAFAEVLRTRRGGANYINESIRNGIIDELVSDLCSVFAADNPNFQKDLFITACWPVNTDLPTNTPIEVTQ